MMTQKRKIVNDPVFGFINAPQGLLLDIINHPFMQRLTRIKQMGLSSVVYPGAQHTRFQHSLGAFYLMSEALLHLSAKGIEITDEEAEAVEAAILMHDLGHGPFSHVLEDVIITGISHEEISLLLMKKMNDEMKGKLDLAIQIFKDEYPKRFLHQLVSGQLDVDRLDHLMRADVGEVVGRQIAPPDRPVVAVTERNRRLVAQPGVVVRFDVPEVLVRVDDGKGLGHDGCSTRRSGRSG